MTFKRPGPIGGLLIRRWIAFLRGQGVQIPLTSDILIAVSGGADSIALAHLVTHYGKRLLRHSAAHSLLHVNHGWRGEESDADEKFVRELAAQWGIPITVHRLAGPPQAPGVSWEDQARAERKKIFIKEASDRNCFIFTAHHADDLAETLLWRLFTGASQSHGGGIAVQHQSEIRPLLTTKKAELKAYLQEEKLSYREDSTNASPRFLRGQMRSQLLPVIERLFPRAVDHLCALGLQAQRSLSEQQAVPISGGGDIPVNKEAFEQNGSAVRRVEEIQSLFFRATGLQLRRPHWNELMERLTEEKNWQGEIHLPEGWVVRRELGQKNQTKGPVSKKRVSERWILEKF